GGPDEIFDKANQQYYREEYESRRREAEKAGIILTGKISVGQLIAMIGKCDLLLGEPSGPSWVAAALGKPTVTIVPSVACSLASGCQRGFGLLERKAHSDRPRGRKAGYRGRRCQDSFGAVTGTTP